MLLEVLRTRTWRLTMQTTILCSPSSWSGRCGAAEILLRRSRTILRDYRQLVPKDKARDTASIWPYHCTSERPCRATTAFAHLTPNTEREHEGHKENTYSTQKIEQFQAGHNDALMMCSTVIEQATKNPKRFDRIFREYFPFSERQLIIGEYAETVISIMAATREIPSLTGYSQVCSKPSSTPTVKAKATPSSKTSTLWTTTRSPRISRISGVRRAMPPPGRSR
jgi:hypothetical protein